MIITSRFPFPLEKGDKLRAYHQIKYLSKFFEIHLISTPDNPVDKSDIQELEKYCKSIHIYPISFLQKAFGILYAFLRKKPFQVGYFYHFTIARKVKKLIHQITPDHIYCQLIRSAEYVKNYHDCPKTLDYMDALSKGMERLSEDSRGIWKLIYNSEYKRLKRYENSIFEYFEHHTIITKQDRNHIFHKNREQIVVIPNGIDESFLNYEEEIEKDTDIIFIGSMSYPPNIAAAEYISHDILPLLPKTTTAKIAGANPAKSVLRLANEQIQVLGFVDNIQSTYKRAKILVAPMFLSVGLQNKLLEAMSIGIPCITTPLANNALQAAPNEEILLASTPEEFAKQIQVLLEDADFYQKIVKNGKNFVLEHYDWNKTTHQLVTLFEGN